MIRPYTACHYIFSPGAFLYCSHVPLLPWSGVSSSHWRPLLLIRWSLRRFDTSYLFSAKVGADYMIIRAPIIFRLPTFTPIWLKDEVYLPLLLVASIINAAPCCRFQPLSHRPWSMAEHEIMPMSMARWRFGRASIASAKSKRPWLIDLIALDVVRPSPTGRVVSHRKEDSRNMIYRANAHKYTLRCNWRLKCQLYELFIDNKMIDKRMSMTIPTQGIIEMTIAGTEWSGSRQCRA